MATVSRSIRVPVPAWLRIEEMAKAAGGNVNAIIVKLIERGIEATDNMK